MSEAPEKHDPYDTANQLGDELKRFLADEPVQAGPPSAGYRARKFLRRNKGAVIAAVLVVLALVGGIIGTSVGLVIAENVAEKERNARALAEKRLAHLKIVNDVVLALEDNLGKPSDQVEKLIGRLLDEIGKQAPDTELDDPDRPMRILRLCASFAGDPIKACERSERFYAEYRDRLGDSHPITLAVQGELAKAYASSGRREKQFPFTSP